MVGRRKNFGSNALGWFRGAAPLALAGVLSLGFASGALAACSDPAGPAVNWAKCSKAKAKLSGAYLREANLSGADLSGANLSLADLTLATLTKAKLEKVDFSSAKMTFAKLEGSNLRQAGLSYAELRGARMEDADLSEANLYDANLQSAHLAGADLTEALIDEADLSRANLSKANLSGAGLVNANLEEANLSFANLKDANLSGSNLRKANLDAAELSTADLSGADLRGASMNLTVLNGNDLRGRDLSEMVLDRASLRGTNLSGANLNFSKLRQTLMLSANLSGAKMVWTNLENANLSKADLTGADLSKADLSGAILTEANLTGADLEEAKLYDVNSIDANLTDSDLTLAKLSGANLANASLNNSVLLKANLTGSNLRGAKLIGADLTEAILTFADLSGATWVDGRICDEGSIGECKFKVPAELTADLVAEELVSSSEVQAEYVSSSYEVVTTRSDGSDQALEGNANAPTATGSLTITVCLPENVRDDGSCAEEPLDVSETPETSDPLPDLAASTPDSTGGRDAGTEPDAVADPSPPIVRVVVSPETLREGRQWADYGTVVLKASGGKAPYQFSISEFELPQGMTLSLAGALSGLPTKAGKFLIKVSAEDANGVVGHRDFNFSIRAPGKIFAPPVVATLTIGPPPNEPRFTCDPNVPNISMSPEKLPAGIVGKAYGPFELTIVGGHAPYSLSSDLFGLPIGLVVTEIDDTTFDDPNDEFKTGVRISGVPEQAGTVGIYLKVLDACIGLSITTHEVEMFDPLSMIPANLPDGTVGEQYGPVDVTINGGKAPYELAFFPSDLPDGLQITTIPDDTANDPTKSQKGLRISGVPTRVSGNQSGVNIFVSDAANIKLIRPYTLKIAKAPVEVDPMSVTPDVLPDGTAGSDYGPVDLIFSGGTPPYTIIANAYYLEGTGLTLTKLDDGTGMRLQGVPENDGYVEDAIVLNALDSLGFPFPAKTYALRIDPYPVVLAQAGLLKPTVAVRFEYLLSASGGRWPYTFAFVGTGPAEFELSRNGLLSGVPNTEGTATFTAQATDKNGDISQEVEFSMSIKDEPCKDGQKKFGGICPPPIEVFVVTKPTLKEGCAKRIGVKGMVANENGVCGCPGNSKVVNGACKVPPKVVSKPKVNKPRAQNTPKAQKDAPIVPVPTTPAPKVNQCNATAVFISCGLRGFTFDRAICDCGAPVPQTPDIFQPQPQPRQQQQQPQSCQAMCGPFQDTAAYEQCFNSRCQ